MIKRISTIFWFFGLLGIYVYCLSPSVSPQGDSGEVVTNALFLGINHPPGYPLFTLIAHLFTLLPLNSVAWRVSLFSTVMHIATLILIYKIVKKIGGSTITALGTVLILGLSYTFWLYSLIAEVFPLNDFFASLLVYISILIYQTKNQEKQKAYWLWLAFISGLAFFHHQTIVLIFPAIGYFLFPSFLKNKSPKLIVPCVSLFLVGILPYSFYLLKNYLPLSPSDWSYPNNLLDVIKIILRMDYGTFSPLQGKDPSLVTVTDKFNQVSTYFRLLTEDFLSFGLGLAIVGFSHIFLKTRRVFIFFLLAFFVSGPFFLSYANFPYKEVTGTGLAILERFYLLPNFFLALLAGLGLISMQIWFQGWQLLKVLPLLVIIFFSLTAFINHLPLVNQRDNFLARNFAEDIISGVPPGGLMIIGSDVPTFTVFYVRYVDNFRSDVEVVASNQFSENNGFRYLKKARPDLSYPWPQIASTSGFLAANLGKTTIRVFPQSVTLPEDYVSSPSGFTQVIVNSLEGGSRTEWQKQNDKVMAAYRIPKPLSINRTITSGDFVVINYYDNLFNLIGEYCSLVNDYSCAQNYFTKAVELDPLKFDGIYHLAEIYEKNGNCRLANENYLLALEVNPTAKNIYSDLVRLASDCFKDKQKAAFYSKSITATSSGNFGGMNLPLNKL